MSKIKLVLMTMVAVFAASAFTAASAFATSESESYLVNGSPIPSGEDLAVEVSKVTTPELVGTGVKISCTTVANDGHILTEGKSSEETLFSNCTVANPTNCKVQEPIQATSVDQVLLLEGRATDLFTPKTGTTFTTIKFENNGGTCSLAGAQAVTGSVGAFIDVNNTEAATEKAEHELTFNASSGGQLELGGTKVTLKLKVKVKLADLKWFAVAMA